MKGKIKRNIGRLLLALVAVTGGALLAPTSAFALGWSSHDLLNNSELKDAGISVQKFEISQLSNTIQDIATFLLGIAVVLFVLKVVLTAIDRILQNPTPPANTAAGGNSMRTPTTQAGSGGLLENIPVVGAYPPEMPWKDVFIHLGKNIFMVLAAWMLVTLVVQIVVWVAETFLKKSTV